MDFCLKFTTFAVPLPDSIMVVRQILDLYVEVRALVGQQNQVKTPVNQKFTGVFLFAGGPPMSEAPEAGAR